MTASPRRATLPGHNLPAPLTSFIGREQELAEVSIRLADSRLLTFTGEGDCGKTRLAVQVARVVLDRYPDGVWQVELVPLSDPALVSHGNAVLRQPSSGSKSPGAVRTRLRVSAFDRPTVRRQ